MRIVAEWKDYDNEIKKLQIKQSEHEDEDFSFETQSKGNWTLLSYEDNTIIIIMHYCCLMLE